MVKIAEQPPKSKCYITIASYYECLFVFFIMRHRCYNDNNHTTHTFCNFTVALLYYLQDAKHMFAVECTVITNLNM